MSAMKNEHGGLESGRLHSQTKNLEGRLGTSHSWPRSRRTFTRGTHTGIVTDFREDVGGRKQSESGGL